MRIAVTGVTGFIGRALCARLRSDGHEVRALVRVRAPELDGRDEVVVGDLARFSDWPRALDGMQAMVHLAGYAHGRGDDQALTAVNVSATRAAAEAARARGVHFVFVSSVKVHGDGSAQPLRETSPLVPAERYAFSKVEAESALRAIAGLHLTVLRPPLVYGAGVKANFHALMHAIARGWPLPLASVDNRRSLIYVGNLVDAIVRCLDAPGTFLVSDGPAISTAQLCREIGEALGRPARLFPFPAVLLPGKLAGSLEVDDSAIRREVGWQPPFSRQQGLQATADWYRARQAAR